MSAQNVGPSPCCQNAPPRRSVVRVLDRPLVLLALALSLWAADSWQSKPAAQWNDKEVQKILTNSPWAKTISVSAGGLMDSDSAVGRGRRGFGGDDSPPRPGGADQMPGGGVGTPGGNVPSRGTENMDTQTASSMPLTVVWESALPVKLALARRKYGAEADTSPEAKKYLEEDRGYLIAVAGLPEALVQAGTARGKPALLQQTSLSVKGQPPVHPSDVEVEPPGKTSEVVFTFPKTTSFRSDDKDVEFSTQFGAVAVRYRFHLKDMLYQGKLEL
jgi:hypothetical protein